MVPLISSATELLSCVVGDIAIATATSCDQGNLRIVLQAKLFPWKGLLERSRLRERARGSTSNLSVRSRAFPISTKPSVDRQMICRCFGLTHLWQSHHTPQDSEQLTLAEARTPQMTWGSLSEYAVCFKRMCFALSSVSRTPVRFVWPCVMPLHQTHSLSQTIDAYVGILR